MAQESTPKWRCSICGYEQAGKAPPADCPICGASSDKFEAVQADTPQAASASDQGAAAADQDGAQAEPAAVETPALNQYLSEWSRSEHEMEEKFSLIQKISVTGRSEISPMGTRKPFPGLETILFRGAQFDRFPLDEHDPVATETVIGPSAKKPLELEIPFYVSHMSFGALSKEAKIALAMGASAVGTAACSGEGGLLPEERQNATRYIYELGTASFSHDESLVRQGDAVEIKFGQAAKPGMGGHLPGEKMTPEIAAIRGLAPGQDFISPNRQPGVDSVQDLKEMVDKLRNVAEGRPIGIKFTAGHIEKDLEFVLAAEPDFITIDCRGGATGAAPSFIRDNVCLPPIYAIRRARKFLDQKGSLITFCVTGGFRDSTDIAKALALGADAVALASASLIAIGCQQYRICNTGNCPVGITTQDPDLRARFSIEASVERFKNFYTVTKEELQTLARINGRSDVHDLGMADIFTISNEVAQNTDIAYA